MILCGVNILPTTEVPNPLAEVINIIPWELTVVSPEFLDEIRSIVNKYHPTYWFTNKYVLLLLAFLTDEKFCELKDIELPTGLHGRLLTIKRKNG